MIRKLKSGGYGLYSRKVNPKTGKRRNLGTFETRAEAEKHERAVQYFKLQLAIGTDPATHDARHRQRRRPHASLV